MSNRYFVESPIAGQSARLQGSEAHHVLHVMRARPGDEVCLFDGSGFEFQASVQRMGRSEVELNVIERREANRELARHVTVAVSLPKGDRQRWLVEKTTELGVTRLVPLITQYSVAQPAGNATARLRRTVIEASKQCGRNRLMEIAEPVPFSDFINCDSAEALRYIAHPSADVGGPIESGHRLRKLTADMSSISNSEIIFAIGPEGGFSDDELSAAVEAGWQPLDLGPRMLRVETAAVAMAACVALVGGGLSL